MFTRLLVGLDGSPEADAALEQAVILGHRFQSRLIVATVVESADASRAQDTKGMMERAEFRVRTAGLPVEMVEREGDPDVELATLAKTVDATLVGRRGTTTSGSGLGRTVASLIRIAEQVVIVCGGAPSSMHACAVAFDGHNRRALDLAARFASVVGSTVHVVHAYEDRAEGMKVVGQAEAMLSLLGVPFQTHLAEGKAAAVVAEVVKQVRADALFAGAHVPRGHGAQRPSVASHTEEILRSTDLPVAIQP